VPCVGAGHLTALHLGSFSLIARCPLLEHSEYSTFFDPTPWSGLHYTSEIECGRRRVTPYDSFLSLVSFSLAHDPHPDEDRFSSQIEMWCPVGSSRRYRRGCQEISVPDCLDCTLESWKRQGASGARLPLLPHDVWSRQKIIATATYGVKERSGRVHATLSPVCEVMHRVLPERFQGLLPVMVSVLSARSGRPSC